MVTFKMHDTEKYENSDQESNASGAAIVCIALSLSQDEGNENSFVFHFSSCPYLIG